MIFNLAWRKVILITIRLECEIPTKNILLNIIPKDLSSLKTGTLKKADPKCIGVKAVKETEIST